MARSPVILLQVALCLTVLVEETYSSISWTRKILHRTKRQAECKPDEFKCTSGECIDIVSMCDGTKECADGSDEFETTCKQLNIRDPPTLSQGGGCLLPQSPEFGVYITAGCAINDITAVCKLVPGTPVPQHWALSFKCNDGYYIEETQDENFHAFCFNGKWSPKIPVCKSLVLVAETYSNISWAREVLHRTKRQAGCKAGSEFKCRSGQCIDEFSKCDGNADCADGSDEIPSQCSSFSCPSQTFRCNYGACIDGNKICNGRKDCVDGSDEAAPACPGAMSAPQHVTSNCRGSEFKCLSGQCIEQFSVCDGTVDCEDGSDETILECAAISCPQLTFRCDYGACIDSIKRCNMQNDCADGSDEASSICFGATPTAPQGVNSKCKNTEFKCTSGQCIDKSFVCDGRVNCADGSDEAVARCSSFSPPNRPLGGSCILPQHPKFGMYTAQACGLESSAVCRQVPGTPFPHGWSLSFKCYEGYYLEETLAEDLNVVCINGKWSKKIPVCKKMCSPLVSLSVDTRCVNDGGVIDCGKPMRPGTRATVKCKPSYNRIPPYPYKEIYCTNKGQWSAELFYCEPVCGRRNWKGVNTPQIAYGSAAKHGEFPWHVGLYTSTAPNQWEHICGGSLISPHIVLTAAHCVFSDLIKKPAAPEAFKVGLGKYYREWTHEEPYAVQADVREVLIPPRYYGVSTSFTHDIALLDLTRSVQLDAVIMPVCVDWQREFTITHGTQGTLAGWGGTEHGKPSDVLLFVDLPYVDYSQCINQVPIIFQHYVTTDKFCGGFTNGTGAQRGDSGGGLTFVQDDLYYVYGIVSTKVQNTSSFITFTNITNEELFTWLITSKNKFDNEHAVVNDT